MFSFGLARRLRDRADSNRAARRAEFMGRRSAPARGHAGQAMDAAPVAIAGS
jgi:hypothetical protein